MNKPPAGFDAVVVGAGVIGATTALELARRGLRVCVLERGAVGREASWAGGGILSPLPPDDPVPEIRELLDESLRRYPGYCAELREATGIDPEYWVCGAWVSEDQGPGRWFPQVAQVRNPRLMRALHRRLQMLGVHVIEQTPALGWQVENGRLTGVQTAQGVIACRYAVLAAGAWSSRLHEAASVLPVKGQMLLLRGRPGQLDHICMDEQAYLIPRRDGRILVGSTLEDAGFDLSITSQARVFLMDCAKRLWPPAASLDIENQWAGLRPRPRGVAPLIGPVPGADGLLLNTGHYRLGITLSLASARRVADLVVLDAVKGF
ncbi:MAG: NAD(P)/FAD-dependent oxidoreductase [Stenotrophobium sp.]